jgi:tetratricopeptide (TPR) repeat protein
VLFFKRPLNEAEKHYREALRYRDRKRKEFDLGLCLWHFKQAIMFEPNNPIFHCQLGRAYIAAPLLAVTHGVDAGFRLNQSAELGIGELKEALRLKPDYPEAYIILGEAYMYLGEKEKALQAFQAVLDLPGSQRLHLYAERESQQVEQGISKNPQPDEARRRLEQAVEHRNRGKHRLAEKELDKALKLAPDWPWLYDNLCRVGG